MYQWGGVQCLIRGGVGGSRRNICIVSPSLKGNHRKLPLMTTSPLFIPCLPPHRTAPPPTHTHSLPGAPRSAAERRSAPSGTQPPPENHICKVFASCVRDSASIWLSPLLRCPLDKSSDSLKRCSTSAWPALVPLLLPESYLKKVDSSQ